MEKIILIIVLGLAWGSFLNVVIYRLPRDMSLLKPPSSCTECGKNIRFYDNIPVLSYIILGGKCRNCKTKISFAYPLVETLTPLSFLILYSQHQLSFFFFASCLFVSGLIILGFVDFYHKILPDEITLSGLVLALIYSLFRPDLTLLQALIGAASGAGFLLLVYGAYYLLRKKEGLGLGDVTMMLFVGAFLGWKLSLFTLILASFTGALVGIILILGKKRDLQYALPYGTFLAPAAFASLLWGQKIIDAYLSLFKGISP
jgi:leader peptidase (prepilin peptidase)/N-methyltransferase